MSFGKYTTLTVPDFNSSTSGFKGSRVIVRSVKITEHGYSDDGDMHINVTDSSGTLMTAELIPEYWLTVPKVGTIVDLWGIRRFDEAHGFYEMHPVLGISERS